MKKYGLQHRVPPSQPKKQPTRPLFPPPLGLSDENEDDIERMIMQKTIRPIAQEREERNVP